MFECLLLIFIYFNSKFKVTCKNWDFECQHIGTHSKEKNVEVSKVTFDMLHFLNQNLYKLQCHPEDFTIYFSWWNHQIRFKLRWFILPQRILRYIQVWVPPVLMLLWKFSVLDISLDMELTANCLKGTCTKSEELIQTVMFKYELTRACACSSFCLTVFHGMVYLKTIVVSSHL